MKKFIVPLVSVVIVVSIIFAGCVPGAAPAPPPELPGWGPMKGVAVKPDGTPYEFAYTPIFLRNEWMARGTGPLLSLVNRAGGEITTYDADFNADRQHDIMEDLITKQVEAIIIHPVDSSAIAGMCDRAEEAGIPVINWNMLIPAEKITCSVTHDQVKMGFVGGQWMIDYAERTGKPLKVFELWGFMGHEGSHRRHEGFHQAVDGHPLITVTEGPDCHWVEEDALNAVADGFTADPTLNAVFSPGDYVMGTNQALTQLNRLYPAGDPNHVIFVTIDADPSACEALRGGSVDGIVSHSPWDQIDICVKAMLTYVCCGKPVPKLISMDTYVIDLTNIDQPPYGAPKLWGEMQVEDYDLWPILDMSEYIETPTVAMKQPGY